MTSLNPTKVRPKLPRNGEIESFANGVTGGTVSRQCDRAQQFREAFENAWSIHLVMQAGMHVAAVGYPFYGSSEGTFG